MWQEIRLKRVTLYLYVTRTKLLIIKVYRSERERKRDPLRRRFEENFCVFGEESERKLCHFG